MATRAALSKFLADNGLEYVDEKIGTRITIEALMNLSEEQWEKRCPGYGDFIHAFLHPSQGILLLI